MRRVISTCVLGFCLAAVPALAQDAKIKSETKIKADDAKVVTMTGCLQGGPSLFTLANAVVPKAEARKLRKSVGTTGTAGVYELSPREGIELGSFVGQQVQVTGVMIPAATAHDKHTKIEIKQKTKAEIEHQPDQKSETKTKADIAKGESPTFSVVSVKGQGTSCVVG